MASSDAGAAPTFADVLSRRRMCRDFLADPLPDDVVDSVASAAFRGPSAGNTPGLEIVVLRGERVGDYWDTTLEPAARTDFPWPGLLRAPVLVVPYVDPGAWVRRYAEADKAHTGLGTAEEDWSVPYWWVDGGAAVMAMLLSAEAAGIGALFFGQFDHEAAVARLLGVPSPHRALGTLALGHPRPGGRNVSASAARERPVRVHRDRWR